MGLINGIFGYFFSRVYLAPYKLFTIVVGVLHVAVLPFILMFGRARRKIFLSACFGVLVYFKFFALILGSEKF